LEYALIKRSRQKAVFKYNSWKPQNVISQTEA
jgi:hypothetical protein